MKLLGTCTVPIDDMTPARRTWKTRNAVTESVLEGCVPHIGTCYRGPCSPCSLDSPVPSIIMVDCCSGSGSEGQRDEVEWAEVLHAAGLDT